MSIRCRGKLTGQHLSTDDDYLTKTLLVDYLPQICFPSNVVIVYKTPQLIDSFNLLPKELDCCQNFSVKRLSDFRLGRACARDVLSSIGITDFPLLIGSSREPIWPNNVVGSISHTNNLAICAALSNSDIASIGVDIEMLKNESFDLLPQVISEQELNDIEISSANCGYLAKLIFSVKESVFKCQFPLTGLFTDFKDISLKLDFDKSMYTTTISYDNELLCIEGAWDVTADYIVSSAWINRI